MSAATQTRALYIERREGAPVFALLHAPQTPAPAPETAVLICPPFGWEEVCSHRARRAWAVHLALGGYPALRLDLPGTGDSADPPGGEQLELWSDALAVSCAWLREETGCARLAVLGIGLGGLVSWLAIARGAPVDELALWGTPARGRSIVRELQAFARMESEQVSVPGEPSPSVEGGVEAGGYLLGPATVAELRETDLTSVALAPGRPRRVLLLGRDGIEADASLRAHLQEAGAEVTIDPGNGYGAMMAEPQKSEAPIACFEALDRWLAGAEETAATPAPPGVVPPDVRSRPSIELDIGGSRVRESPFSCRQSFGEVFGVLAEPVGRDPARLGAVILNAGAIAHTGPNRMWVEIARRWASQGVSTLRLDLGGIGDSDGEDSRELAELYTPALVAQARLALDELQRQRPLERFVLMGLCSGAYWSFHGALEDERVGTALMLNPQALFWHPSLEAQRELRRVLLSGTSWSRLIHGEAPVRRLLEIVRQVPAGLAGLLGRLRARRRARGGGAGEDALGSAMDELARSGKRAVFVFSGGEPLEEELAEEGWTERLAAMSHVELDYIPGHDHTLRPAASRRAAMDVLDREMARELAGSAARESTG